jgi:cation:H+ antiporter
MDWAFYSLLFLVSCGLLYAAGELIVAGLVKLSRYFGLTEFVVAFFVMAVAASLPNLFIGITSALDGIPELSFGDILGNNLVALTLAVSLAVFFSSHKAIEARSPTIQTTSYFTFAAALLPLVLISDGALSRGDGLVLIGLFIAYLVWLFSKKERFTKVYEEHHHEQNESRLALFDLFRIAGGAVLLLLAAKGIVSSASFMAEGLGLPLVLVGILVVGLGSAMPQIYFAVRSARYGETSLILGNLMGAVIIPASLILGIVALLHPIQTDSLEFFGVSRFFLILAATFFLLFARTGREITGRESAFLLLVYLSFVATILLLA